ncbi:site-specific integrase [Actinomadura sp. LOL_016]|uniref:site-specific integrase n=1 Tax=unclassified Actinomadura TaxID=2626254 RepID=UPI003A80E757
MWDEHPATPAAVPSAPSIPDDVPALDGEDEQNESGGGEDAQTAIPVPVSRATWAKMVKVGVPKYKVNRGLTVVQARDVLKAAQDERLYALYVLALCLGLRRGELLGLRWDDLTLVECRACDGEGGEIDGDECEVCAGNGVESGTLEVVQTLQRVGGALRFVRPKTDDSERSIPLPPVCITALCGHKVKQAGPNGPTRGTTGRTAGSSFRLGGGRPWSRTTFAVAGAVSGRLQDWMHDMRHTCVSLLLHLGIAPNAVREIVGHSDIEVTMTIYAHTSLDDKRAALRKLGDALG